MKLALFASAALMLQACTPGLAPDSTGYEPAFPSHGSAPATPSPKSEGSCPDPGGEPIELGRFPARVVYAPRDGATIFVRESSRCWRQVYAGSSTRTVQSVGLDSSGWRGLLMTVSVETEAGPGRATVFAKYENGRYRTVSVGGCELDGFVFKIPQAECEAQVERYATP